ncbi:pyrroline-5-carboxylate reductase [Sphingorhabdus sp. Alg239-R122]|uniref:pyrroline-5-carboxylate reductase n=1 Tax=Sphingorhabdus sp. Alg239-R122 TaxID=2305989 RepID=UPI0013D97176|nr:pyrroline-5-carboxylate reductase [Sphingorhabdus sp. Alg239-R122]
MTAYPKNLTIFGCGNMAGAMLHGWLADGMDPARVTVITPNGGKVPEGIRILKSAPTDMLPADMLLIGIKPYMLADLAQDIAPLAGPATMLVSILAGVDVATTRSFFPDSGPIVRAMPNMAVSIGKSPIGIFSEKLDAAQHGLVDGMMVALGSVEWLDREELIHLIIAVSGSGPAYLFRFIDALAKGVADLGLPKDQADRLALAMVEGAAELASKSGENPGVLADQVASPGGTTRQALNVFDEDNALNKLVHKAAKAAYERSIEMEAEEKGN